MEEIKENSIQQTQDIPQQDKAEEQKEASPSIQSEENQVNWRKFREERERDRKAREEAEKKAKQKAEEAAALQAAMEAILSKPVQTSVEDEEDEDKRIERRVQEAIKKEREKQEEERRQREAQELPQRIRREITDFDRVCTQENIDYLEYHFPEVAKGLEYMPDGFDKWNLVYRAVKRFVPFENKNEDSKRIEKNLMKPQAATPNIVDKNPVGSPWNLSEDRKRANWERMQREMKSM